MAQSTPLDPGSIRALMRVAVELLLPIALFVLTPILFGAPWSVILLGVPDVGPWALAALIPLFATGVIRGALARPRVFGKLDG